MTWLYVPYGLENEDNPLEDARLERAVRVGSTYCASVQT